jgi:VWFA-related protein
LPSALTSAFQPDPLQRPAFRAGANFVYVDAYPTRDGKLIDGLTAADFQVFEDGKPQAIDLFELIRFAPNTPDEDRRDPGTQAEGDRLAADPRNRAFVVYLDSYHTTVGGSHRARAPMIQFLSRVIGVNDLFAVMTPETDVRQLTFGRRLETIERELTTYWTWGIKKDPETANPNSPQSDPRTPAEQMLWSCFIRRHPDPKENETLILNLIALSRLDTVFTSLEGLAMRLRGLREERSHVLLLGEGWVPVGRDLASDAWPAAMPSVGVTRGGQLTLGSTQPDQVDKAACNTQLLRLSSIDFPRRFRDLLNEAGRSNVAIHPIDLAGLRASARVGGQAWDREVVSTMLTLAENTGGQAAVNTNDLNAALRKIADDLSAYYLLGYYSTNGNFDGRFRSIDVRLRSTNSRVSARRGYAAPSAAALKAAETAARVASAAPRPNDEAAAALARLRPGAEIATHAIARPRELVVVAEIGSREVEMGRWRKGGQVHVTAVAGDRKVEGQAVIEPGLRGALLRIPVDADVSEPWRVLLRIDGPDGPLEDRVDVKPSQSKLLGEPVAYRATPAPASPLRPVADFQYRRTERVHIEWPALGPVERREVRVLDRRGQPLALGATLTAQETDGRAMLAVDLNLAPLTDGDYIIEVTAGQGTDVERKYVAIRVVR